MWKGLGIGCHKERIVFTSKNLHRFLKAATLASPVKKKTFILLTKLSILDTTFMSYLKLTAVQKEQSRLTLLITVFFLFLTPPTPTL